MKYLVKPPSKKMIAQLQRGRAIELSEGGNNFCGIDDFKNTLPELYERRLIDIKMETLDGIEILCVFITKQGIAFLERYEEGQKVLRSEYTEPWIPAYTRTWHKIIKLLARVNYR